MSKSMTLIIHITNAHKPRQTRNGMTFTCPVKMSIVGANSREFDKSKVTIKLATLLAKTLSTGYSGVLGNIIFAERGVDNPFQTALAISQNTGIALHVGLELADDVEILHDIEWERSSYPQENVQALLGVTADTPFFRYVPKQSWVKEIAPIVERPIRVLTVVGPNVPDQEIQDIRKLFDDDLKGRCQVSYLKTSNTHPLTLNRLRQELTSNNRYHMIHFLCHGNESAIQLDEIVPNEMLAQLMFDIGQDKRPAFCFLTACKSGKGVKPLGWQLVRKGGIAATLAMTDFVLIATANKFMSDFYLNLFAKDGGVLDLAINRARSSIQNCKDWGVPVLFSRLFDNRLLIIEDDENGQCLDGTFYDDVCWTVADIERLLIDAFTYEGLGRFIRNNFPVVGRDISDAMPRSRIVGLLLDHCKVNLYLEQLLKLIKQDNQRQYNHHRVSQNATMPTK